jgi:hypothetical protein
MDVRAVLDLFDAQLRRAPPPDAAGDRIEREPHVTRCVPAGAGWTGITWSDLDEENADAVIRAEIERFARAGRPWEWKHYSYDRPPDLPDRLLAAGFAAGPSEALLVAEVEALALVCEPPKGVELRPVVDERGVRALVAVHEAVFGEEDVDLGALLLARLGGAGGRRGAARGDHGVAAVVAMAGEEPIAEGRVELPHGSDFATLYGGATVGEWRHRGVYRSLVAHRASVARDHCFRYLQVDASAESQPILRRLGFVDLAATTPFEHPGPDRRHATR